jgi:peptide/nickel transport system permease protein
VQRYAIRRLAYMPVIIAVVSTLTFVVLRLPFARDPVPLMLGMDATPEQRQALREDLGLDRPIPEQYLEWVKEMATGDLGKTFRGNQPIWREISRRLPVTFEIMILALLFSTTLGVSVGVFSAIKQNTLIDYVARFGAVFGQSIPEFFLLVLLIVLPSIWWNYSPPVGGHISIFEGPWDNLRLYLPPAILLGFGHASGMMRLTRSTMLEVFRQDYVRTARAKGLREKDVIVRHSLRNGLIPLVTLFGAQVGALFFGSLIFEQIFSIQGIGQFFFQSISAADMPVIQILSVYTAVVIISINLIVDLSYALLDPRVGYR